MSPPLGVMSPLELSVCIHYHSSCEDMPWVWSEAPAVDPTMEKLVYAGLLRDGMKDEPRRYYSTPKLHAFVEMLCKTPFPEQAWIDPRTREFVCP